MTRHWLLPLLSLALVLVVAVWEMGTARTGPGPLHPAHAAVPELRGGSRCEACHRQGQGIDQNQCLACHAPIGRQRGAATGLHGSLPGAQLAACAQCHPEHHGTAAPLIAASAFARAGVDDLDHYDHRHVPKFTLVGAHQALACERCHRAARALAAPGGRFLGRSQECASCHEDVHRGAYGQNCEECHGQQLPFTRAPGFRHDALPLHGAHARQACTKCHVPGTPHETKALALRPQPARKCADCHQDPHHADTLGQAKALLLSATGDCSRCHDSTTWSAARLTPEQHGKLGFPLRGAHATVACGLCHGDGAHPPRYGKPAPAVEGCAACHQHPHGKALVAAAVAGRGPQNGCGGCHRDADAKFAAGTMTAAQHALTGFVLSPPHAKVDCKQCHQGTGWRQRFPGRGNQDCRACHQDVHKGQFDHEPRYAQCTACHVETAFVPHAFDVAAHQRTAFPLTGSHEAVACQLCHQQQLQRGVRAFHGTGTGCAGCHRDVHQGAFDGPQKPAVVEGRTGCQRCHDTRAFQPVAAFDHALWTGYALAGSHQRAACTACHPSQPGQGARRLGKAAGKRCADCHRDVHQGQFAAGGPADCARCHGEDDFARSRFDHQQDSRFALDAQHKGLACAACHKPWPSPAGPVVRYKPLGVTCGDCHRLGVKGGKR